MNVPGRRQERLAGQIHTEVAKIITGELKDPRIGFVTVTRVEVTADLHFSRIWVSVLGGDEEQKKTLAGLQSAAGYIRREIGQRLGLRHSPEVSFLLDHGAEESIKVEFLLQKLRRESSDQ